MVVVLRALCGSFSLPPSVCVSVRDNNRTTGPHSLPFYPTIVLDTGAKVETVPDWLKKNAPMDAAAGKEYVGRLMGKVT